MLNRRFIVLLAITFLNWIAAAPVMTLLAVYMEADLHQPPIFAAWLRSINMLLIGLFALLGGALCDSLGRKRTFLLGLTGTLALATIFLVRDPRVLVLLFIYAGITAGFQTTAGQTYMMASVPQSSMGKASAAFFLGGTLGNALGNFAVVGAINYSGFAAAGAGLVVLSGITILATLVLLPSLPVTGEARTFSFRETLGGYRGIMQRRDVQLLLGIRYIPFFYWGMATLLIPLLIYRAAGSPEAAALYAGVSSLLAPAFQMLTGRVCDRIGYQLPVLVTIGIVPLAAGLAAIFTGSVPGLYVAGILGAVAAWSLSTAMPGLIRSVAGQAEQGRFLGVTELAWSMGMLSGNLVGGQLVDVNPALPFLVATMLGLPAIAMASSLFSGKRLEVTGRSTE